MRFLNLIKKKAPTILSLFAVGGVIATAIVSAKNTVSMIRKRKESNLKTKKDKVKFYTKSYSPTIVVSASTIFCIVSSNILNQKRIKSLVSAYVLLSNAFNEYKNEVKKEFGEESHNNIISNIAEKKEKPDPTKGKILFYDEFSERYFWSTTEAVIEALYHFNRNFTLRGDACINELYEFLGIPKIDGGDELGFSSYQFMEDGLMPWIDFEVTKAVSCDGTEFRVLSSMWNPIARYYELDSWGNA